MTRRAWFTSYITFLLLLLQQLPASCDTSNRQEERVEMTPFIKDALALGRTIYVYVPPKEFVVVKKPTKKTPKFIGKPINAGDSKVLWKLKNWLYSHDEYLAEPYYIVNRLRQDARLYTNNINEAQLCYPSCTYMSNDDYKYTDGHGKKRSFYMRRDYSQFVRFEVVPKYRPTFKNCSYIAFFIEPGESDNWNFDTGYNPPECVVMAPYLHSIYFPSVDTKVAPWELNSTRDILLVYFGSARRDRLRTILDLHKEASGPRKFQIAFDKNINSVFFSPDRETRHDEDNSRWGFGHMRERENSEFYLDAWELYATSYFSWQPQGDTPTRRAFYDSWMLGCIPVIDEGAAFVYGQLFNGIAFQEYSLKDMAVVVSPEMMHNGPELLRYLAGFSIENIEERRYKMAKLAPIMQWGWGGRVADALLLVFASLMKGWTYRPTAAPVRFRPWYPTQAPTVDPKALVIASDNKEFALPPPEHRRSGEEMEKHYHSLQKHWSDSDKASGRKKKPESLDTEKDSSKARDSKKEPESLDAEKDSSKARDSKKKPESLDAEKDSSKARDSKKKPESLDAEKDSSKARDSKKQPEIPDTEKDSSKLSDSKTQPESADVRKNAKAARIKQHESFECTMLEMCD